MALSNTKLNEALKAQYLPLVINALEANGEEVLRTGSAEVAIPVVDSEGNEKFVRIVISVPTGSRKDADPYDGYSMAESYALTIKQNAEKKAKAEKAKAEKIKRDAVMREKAKANREKAVSGS